MPSPAVIRPVSVTTALHHNSMGPRQRPAQSVIQEPPKQLSAVAVAAPNPVTLASGVSPLGSPMFTFEELMERIKRVSSAALSSQMTLPHGRIKLHGLYGTTRLCIRANTTCDVQLQVDNRSGKPQIVGGHILFSQPVKIKNPIGAFVEPVGAWQVGRPLLGWAASYSVVGLRFSPGGANLIGNVHILHSLHSKHLDQAASDALRSAMKKPETKSHAPVARRSLEASNKLLVNPVPFLIEGSGQLPPNFAVDFATNFLSLSGGDYRLHARGTATPRGNGNVDINITPDKSGAPLFDSPAFQVDVCAASSVAFAATDSHVTATGSGRANIQMNRARFDARPKENFNEGGILVAAGDARGKRPLQPALRSQTEFSFTPQALRAKGNASVMAAAIFLGPETPEPDPTQEEHALDVSGALKFNVDTQAKVPDLNADGTMYLKVPDNDAAFAYHLSVSDKGVEFEPLPIED